MEKEIILGIDPGSASSGIVILKNRKIKKGDNIKNEDLFTLLDEYTLLNERTNELMVVYEDIRPYACQMNMYTIQTIKMIGRLEYVLNQRRVSSCGVARNKVKDFLYKRYENILAPDVSKVILKRGKAKKDGKPPAPSFHYVNDRMVAKTMKMYWDIPTPKPGRKSLYDLSDHSWQALGAVTCWMNETDKSVFSI
jgi:hypothetical protein